LFQFEGIAEASLQHDDWTLFRESLRGNGDIDRYIADLSRPDAPMAGPYAARRLDYSMIDFPPVLRNSQ
jgi:hypothetical protein